MTTQRTAPRALRWPLRLTWAGLWAERATRALWPLWSVVFVSLALWGTGWLPSISPTALWIVIVSLILAILAGVWHARHFRWPTRADALARLDETLPGRPIQALSDAQGIGTRDAASASVWQAHLTRMEARLKGARAAKPDLSLAQSDPYALRYGAVLLLALTALFGGVWRGSDLGTGLGSGPAQAIQTGPAWEAWLEPPRYTGKPTIYLADLPQGPVEMPVGTQVILRLYGQVGAISVSETVSGRDSFDPTEPEQSFEIKQSGTLAITGDEESLWSLVVLEDAAPTIAHDELPRHAPPSGFQLRYSAQDDYGIEGATVRINLDLSAINRRYGLATAPEPRADLVLTLPLPISGDRSDILEVFEEDVSKHPFANLPVRFALEATDAAQNVGLAAPFVAELPGRSFFDPFANALIEQRRDLLWSRQNAPRVAMVLRTITHHREEGLATWPYALTRTAIHYLERDPPLSGERRDEVAEALWQAALFIEERSLESAFERLEQARERLSEAIRQGASPEEIERLTQELREAMDNYIRERARQQAQQNQEFDQPQNQQQGQQITPDQLDQLMERIQELMEEGRTAEAQQLLEELQQMMENMQVQQQPGGQGGEGQQQPGAQSMQEMQDALRDQQGLSDEAFRQLQEQFNPGAQAGENAENQGRNGGQGQGESHEGQEGDGDGEGQDGALAGRQESLGDRLEQLRRNLPGQGSEAGDAARDALDEANRQMDEAARGLAENRLAEALDNQSRAMDALREGIQQLGEALAEQQQQGQGQRQAEGRRLGEGARDPLNRPQRSDDGRADPNGRLAGSGEGSLRLRELTDEIRRRSAEQDRPAPERDYLERLLERF